MGGGLFDDGSKCLRFIRIHFKGFGVDGWHAKLLEDNGEAYKIIGNYFLVKSEKRVSEGY